MNLTPHIRLVDNSPTDGTEVFHRLSALGYTPVPIVPHDKPFTVRAKDGIKSMPGGKSPGRYDPGSRSWHGMAGWQRFFDHPPQQHTLAKWASWVSGGVPGAGILTGRVVAVDIDVTHPKLASAVLESARSIFGDAAHLRFGRAPKCLLVYRLSEGHAPIRKMKSASFSLDDHHGLAIEVLGQGQQFVAYGVHPQSGKPYRWADRSLLDTPLDALTPVTPAKLAEFLDSFEFIASDIYGAKMERPGSGGLLDAADLRDGFGDPVDRSDRRGLIAEAMASLPAGLSDDYHAWVRVGLAVKAALPHDEGLAFDLWDEFSAKSDKYDPEATREKWHTLHPQRIGAGTLYYLAREHGWRPSTALPESEFSVAEDDVFSDMPSGDPEAPGDTEPSRESGLYLAPFDDSELPPRPWLLGQHLMRGQITLLVAPGGVGKSTLTLSWAASLATGQNLAHAKPHETCRTWLVNNEDDSDELRRRLSALMRLHGLEWLDLQRKLIVSGEKRFCVAERRDGLLQPSKHVETVIETMKQQRIGLLIVDPLVSTHPANENDNNEIEAVMWCYRKIARETNAAVCLVHHTSKPPGGSSEGFAGNAHAGRGASAIVNAARIGLTLFDMSEQDAAHYGLGEQQRRRFVRLDEAKANLSLRGSTARWFYRESITLGNGDEVGTLRPETLQAAEDGRQSVAREHIEALMDEAGEDRVPFAEVVKALQGDPLWVGMSRTSVSRVLDGFLSADKLEGFRVWLDGAMKPKKWIVR